MLAWLRWRFVAFATDGRPTTTLALIAQALAAAGGVPGKILAERMACLKGGVLANVVVPTPDYVRFAAHHGFAPDFCHANDPQSNGIVKNLVGYAQRELTVPLLSKADLAGRPVDVHTANTAAAWCLQVNAMLHSEISAVPTERLVTERAVLHRLPSLRLDVGPAPVTRTVDRLSCVRFASVRYSVPRRLIGVRVHLIQQAGRLQIAEPRTGEVVADHPLTAPGEVSVLDSYPNTPPQSASSTAFSHADLLIAGARSGLNHSPNRSERGMAEPADHVPTIHRRHD